MPGAKLVTFQTWVYRYEWWRYQQQHAALIPFPLIDRSPCQDPFLDHLVGAEEARPVVSGLCRAWKNFDEDGTLIYVARADPRVLGEYSLRVSGKEDHYFAVAGLSIERIYPSHAAFAIECEQRHYLNMSTKTDAPPNIVITPKMENAAPKEACILFRPERTRGGHITRRPILGAADESGAVYRLNLREYVQRERDHDLRVAECRLLRLASGPARRLTVESATLLAPSDWADCVEADEPSFNGRVNGHKVRPEMVERLLTRCFS